MFRGEHDKVQSETTVKSPPSLPDKMVCNHKPQLGEVTSLE